jgi:hypothetical protein
MYQIEAPMSAQADAMGKFTNAAFATAGLYLLGPTLGWTAEQSFGAYALAYAAFIVKLAAFDGKDLFNPVGGFVWAALFAGAGAIALKQ